MQKSIKALYFSLILQVSGCGWPCLCGTSCLRSLLPSCQHYLRWFISCLLASALCKLILSLINFMVPLWLECDGQILSCLGKWGGRGQSRPMFLQHHSTYWFGLGWGRQKHSHVSGEKFYPEIPVSGETSILDEFCSCVVVSWLCQKVGASTCNSFLYGVPDMTKQVHILPFKI